MNPSVAAVALLLASPFFFFSSSFVLQAEAHADSGGCCLEYSKRPISLNRLVSYEYANSNCPLPAVIFITKLKKRICADPKADWTKQRVRHLPSPTN